MVLIFVVSIDVCRDTLMLSEASWLTTQMNQWEAHLKAQTVHRTVNSEGLEARVKLLRSQSRRPDAENH